MHHHHLPHHLQHRHEEGRDGQGGHGSHGSHGERGHRHGPDAERHHAERRHAKRRERIFEAGGLKLLALHLLAEQPSHGYDLIRSISELVGGDYTPSPGTVYPTLSYLVDMGQATAAEMEGGRKQYAITAQGQQALQEQAEALQQLLARLAQGRERGVQERPAALVRALENFKTALRLKTRGLPEAPAAPLSEAQISALAAIIDQAALQIEKV